MGQVRIGIRAVTHLDVSEREIDTPISATNAISETPASPQWGYNPRHMAIDVDHSVSTGDHHANLHRSFSCRFSPC